MTTEDIRKAYFATKAGFLDEKDLRFVRSGQSALGETLYYACPCGSDVHCAARAFLPWEPRTLSPVLNCYFTNNQWLVRPVDLYGTIREEAKRYWDLVRRAPSTIRKVIAHRGQSEETIAFLQNTHGIDRELFDEIMEDGL